MATRNIGIRGFGHEIIIDVRIGTAEELQDYCNSFEEKMEGWVDREHYEYLDCQIGSKMLLSIDVDRSIEEYGSDFNIEEAEKSVTIWYNRINDDEFEFGLVSEN